MSNETQMRTEKRSAGNSRPKWHLKHFADAMKELSLRFEVCNPQYTLESDNRMVYGWLCSNGGESYSLMEIHVTNLSGTVHFNIYELKMQMKK